MIRLSNLLNELNIRPKAPIGSGAEQTVYPFNIKPGFVIKRFTADEELYDKDEWEQVIETSKKHPSIFAAVDKVDIDKGYFIQEKLDEQTLTKECHELSNYLIKNNIDSNYTKYSADLISFYYLYPNRLSILENTPRKSTLKPKLEDFFNRLTRAGYGPTKKYIGDIRIENVGYDIHKQIKILDFNFSSEYDTSGIDTPGDPTM
jgi:hypothetical protein